MKIIPSIADPYCDADYCPDCKNVLTRFCISNDEIQRCCMNGDCDRFEIPEGFAGVSEALAGPIRRSNIRQAISAIDALLDDGQVITLRVQDREFVASAHQGSSLISAKDKDSWLVAVLGVALAWASDGEIGSGK